MIAVLMMVMLQINDEKNFAFMEFRTTELTSKALTCDGVDYQRTYCIVVW